MNKYTQQGVTLIELIVFITIIGLATTAVFTATTQVMRYGSLPNIQLQAAQLANARMAIILHDRQVNGFTNVSDRCSSGSPPDACTPLSDYATSFGFTVTTQIQQTNVSKRITVTVTGSASYQLVSDVSDYEHETTS